MKRNKPMLTQVQLKATAVKLSSDHPKSIRTLRIHRVTTPQQSYDRMKEKGKLLKMLLRFIISSENNFGYAQILIRSFYKIITFHQELIN